MIDLVNVTKTYETGTHALNGIDMHIDDGEFVFLVGPSGSGKSTIIKLLTAEVRPTEGKVLVNNYNIGEMKKSRIPVELPGFLTGKHIKKDYTESYSGKEVCIEVLDDGKIADMGTHDELMARCGIYQEIYQSQQEGVQEA